MSCQYFFFLVSTFQAKDRHRFLSEGREDAGENEAGKSYFI